MRDKTEYKTRRLSKKKASESSIKIGIYDYQKNMRDRTEYKTRRLSKKKASEMKNKNQ
jgi:predicted adenine nucleotide alpha hydrolase (AANH) superfamily ATPase